MKVTAVSPTTVQAVRLQPLARTLFRWETFNTFNHTQFGGVSVWCSGLKPPGEPCTGPNNIGNGEIGYARSPRIMQLGLKLVF